MSRAAHSLRRRLATRSGQQALMIAGALLLLVPVLVSTVQWYRAVSLANAIAAVPVVAVAADVGAGEDGSIAGPVADAAPAVRLAWANALSRGGEFGVAESLYAGLTDTGGSDAVANVVADAGRNAVADAARYNLANAYLRESLREGLPGNESRALLELAKQRYRDLLLASPDHRNARYNLERALRFAPELAYREDGDDEPVKRVNVVVPDFTLKDLP